MPQKGSAFIGILIGLVITAGLFGVYYLGAQKNTTYPSLLLTPTPVPAKSTWQKYKSGQVLSGISIQYPSGWTVNYKKESNLSSDYAANYRLTFDFAPSGWNSQSSTDWMGWGEMSFDVYDPQTDINLWLNQYLPKYKDGLIAKEDSKIGNKPTFLIQADGKKDWAIGWLPRDVIFGTDFSYEVGYSQNGNGDFVKVLKQAIFPTIKIN